ncbi:inositol monophosphatase family protein [Chitinibacteraceae bacterium HSL-7]
MLDAVCALARRVAREEIMPRFLAVKSARKDDGSLFTEADLASQLRLSLELPRLNGCPVLGEEMTSEEQQTLWDGNPDGLWVVDPIDGTTNFVHGLPYFAVSIALMKRGHSQLGVVYVPVLDECYCALAGEGAWLNGQRLPLITRDAPLCEAVAVVETKWLDHHLPSRVVSVAPFASQRNFGASTIDWCFLAAGRVDVLLHGAQKLWDYAAGALIAEEAGCVFTTLSGRDYWQTPVWSRSLKAARNQALFAPWSEWVAANR